MDGTWVPRRRRAPRLGRAPIAAAIAAALMPAGAATAQTTAAAERFAPGSPAVRTAQAIAAAHWGVDPCGGAVEIAWGPDVPTVNARAFWSNATAYGDPSTNLACRIVFNAALSPSWIKLCTVLVHEYGHLVGHDHAPDGTDVMSPIYRAPLPACLRTPDPSAEPRAKPTRRAARRTAG